MKESMLRKIVREEIKAIREADVTLPANVKRFMTKFVGALKASGLNRKRQVAVLGGVVDAMNIEPRKLMMMIKKVKQGIDVDESVALKKTQLKGMIKRAKKSGAKGYDIILSLSKDLSVAPDEIVSALEKTRLIGMTEWTKRRI
jgi:hypothetical protein